MGENAGATGAATDREDALRGRMHELIRVALMQAGALYWRHAVLLSVLMFAAFAAMMMGLWHYRPIYNWDMLPYLASIVPTPEAGDAVRVHAYAYSTVRDAVPPAVFAELTQTDAYRMRQFADPDAFLSMLGMYEVKWLYVALLKMFAPIVGPVAAFDMINATALVILLTSVGLWLAATGLSGYAPLFIALLFLLQFQGFAVTQQPDFLANALLVAAVLSYHRKRDVLGSVILFVSVLVRPDQVAVSGVLMACIWFARDRAVPVFALSFAACLVAYGVLSQTFHPTGWWPHFWFSTYQIQEDMTSFKPAFSIVVYAKALALNLYRSLFLNTWLGAYLAALCCGGYLYFRQVVASRRSQALLFAMLLATAAKFAIFPLHDGRIYFSPLLVFFLIAFAETAKPSRTRISPQKQARAGDD